jgi:iron complex transport system substrate-binding protein
MKVRGAKPRRAGAIVLAVVALSALVACGAPPPTPASAAETVTVTDIVGRQVQVKAAAERIFLGEGRLLYLMAMLDREEPLRRIVGWPNDLKTADFDTYERYREQFPQIDQIPESERSPRVPSPPGASSTCGRT